MITLLGYMRYHLISLFLVLIFLLINCEVKDFDQQYYSTKNSEDLLSHIEEMVGHKIEATSPSSKIVILITYESYCSSCLSEVKWWEQNQKKIENADVYILVTSKYKSIGKAFLDQQKITIPSIFDTTNVLMDNDLIPLVPLKILMNSKGEIQLIHNMDGGKKLDDFLEVLSE